MPAKGLIKATDIFTFLNCYSNFSSSHSRDASSGSSFTLVVSSSVSTVFWILRSATVFERWNRLSTCSSVVSSYLHDMLGEQLMTVAKKVIKMFQLAYLLSVFPPSCWTVPYSSRKIRFVDATIFWMEARFCSADDDFSRLSSNQSGRTVQS